MDAHDKDDKEEEKLINALGKALSSYGTGKHQRIEIEVNVINAPETKKRRCEDTYCGVCKELLEGEEVRFDCGCIARYCMGCSIRTFSIKRECPCCKRKVYAYIPSREEDLWDLEWINKNARSIREGSDDENFDPTPYLRDLLGGLPSLVRAPVARTRTIFVPVSPRVNQ